MPQTNQTKEVHQFISDLLTFGQDKADIVIELYQLFEKSSYKFTNKFIYGGIGIYVNETLIGGIYTSKHHVSLVFSDGYKLDDPHKVLEGGGKYRRHIKLDEYNDIESKHCSMYIKKLFELHTATNG